MTFHAAGHLHGFTPAGTGDVRYALHGPARIGYFAFGFGGSVCITTAHGPPHRIPRTALIYNLAFPGAILALRDAVFDGQALSHGDSRRREGHAGNFRSGGDLPFPFLKGRDGLCRDSQHGHDGQQAG